MADSVQRRGRDTFVGDSKPNMAHPQSETLKLHSGHAKIFVHLPLPGVRRRTIEQAILSVPVVGSVAANTVTATPVDEEWAPRKTTWNDQPAVRVGQAVAAAQGAKTDGQRIEIDVTAHVQAVADGATHYGWHVTSNSAGGYRVYGFASPDHGSWVLEIDFTEAPEAPTDLAPNGTVVGAEPVLTFDFVDAGGESTELASVRVQVNTSATAVGAWDSGHVDAVTPEFDLAASAWPVTPVDGTTYYYRVFVKDGAGYESDPSDWATFIYDPKPVLTVDNPATGIAWDPTPTFSAHIDSGVIKVWRMRISRIGDKSDVIYDSGRKKGNGTDSLAHTIPFRDEHGRRILKDEGSYWLNIRIWDRNDRQPTPGHPASTQEWIAFSLDDDADPPPAVDLTAVQIGGTPRVQLTWFRATGFPEGWVIHRDGEVIARLDPDEVDVDEDIDQYQWVDPEASPWTPHHYRVKVIDGGKQSVGSNIASVTTEVSGLWLLSDSAGDVVLNGEEVGDFRSLDKRATYSPLNGPRDVDIVHALGGIAGKYQGTIDGSDPDQDWETARASVLAMKAASAREVQVVFGNASFPAHLRNVSVLPAPEFMPDDPAQLVTFEAWQTRDFGDV